MRESTAVAWLRLVSCGGALLGLAGCGGAGAFECEQASQCSLPGQVGTCEPDGYCSFPDPTCPSGQRYGEHAGAGLAKTCVPTQGTTADSATTDGVSATHGGTGTSLTTTADPLPGDDTTDPSTTLPIGSDGTTTAGPMTTSSTTSSIPGTSSATSSASSTDGASTGPLPPIVLSYEATIAECNAPGHDPDACELGSDPPMGALVVDLDDTGIGPIHAYLRFDFDAALVPEDVVAVTLRMVATDISSSSSSGEVYQVEPFELMDLYALQPATVGPVLAPDQGAVSPNDVIEWALPPDLLSSGEPSLHLGVLPLVTNGTDYWNLDGARPPELIVEQLP